jgi:DNA (cytosine-5)-methyltransferase 1
VGGCWGNRRFHNLAVSWWQLKKNRENKVVTKKKSRESFSYVDLFAGCGGFSLGLESAGGNLIFALERSPMAGETFFRNLIDPQASSSQWENYLSLGTDQQAATGLIVSDIKVAFANKKARSILRSSEIDLIVGGPPCQGFSLAGRRDPEDKRNSLAWDYLDYVKLAKPKFVVIENVLGMNARFQKSGVDQNSIFNQLAIALAKTGPGYVVQKLQLNARHYGAAQNRERLFLVGCRKDVARELSVSCSDSLWKSDFKDVSSIVPDLAPKPTELSSSSLTVGEAIGDLHSGGKTSRYVKTLCDSRLWRLAPTDSIKNNQFRFHNSRTELKFELYLALNKLNLSPLLMRTGLSTRHEEARLMELAKVEKSSVFPIIGSRGQVLAKNFVQLNVLLEEHKTRKHSQRVLQSLKTPPTVITSPDDYIHPLAPRVLTVRELARFQGFSDYFVFYSKETTGGLKRRTEVPQYSQVGNAVSPFVSRAFGLLVRDLLR